MWRNSRFWVTKSKHALPEAVMIGIVSQNFAENFEKFLSSSIIFYRHVV